MKLGDFKGLSPFQQAVILLLERAVKALESIARRTRYE